MSAEVLAAVGGREPLHFLLEMSSRLFSGLLLFISFFFFKLIVIYLWWHGHFLGSFLSWLPRHR